MKTEYDFDKYICKVTGLTCCGCSLFCEHRQEKVLPTADTSNKPVTPVLPINKGFL